MTPTDLLTDLRVMISDENSARWTDATLRAYMYDTELAIVGAHPEAQYETAGRVTRVTVSSLSSNSSSFTVDSGYRTAMLHGTAFRVFMGDGDDAANQKLAQDHFKLFQEALK